MKTLRTIGILAIVAGLMIGGTGNVFAKGPPDEPPGSGPHSPGKRGLFGTVDSADGYDITLVTKEGSTVEVTLTDTAKYMVPKESKGPVDRDGFETILDGNVDGDITAIVERRIAVLVTFTGESTADAMRLMLIPSPSSAPTHAHRVGIVTPEFTPYNPGENGSDGSIEIIDKDGVSHTFTITEDTVYRPSAEDGGISELQGEDLIAALVDGCVTVVTKGDPKKGPEAKAIVLHEELPDWAQP